MISVFSTASGALVVGGVRDIYSSSIHPGDRFDGVEPISQWQSLVVCGSLW